MNSSLKRPHHTCGEPGEQLFPSEAVTHTYGEPDEQHFPSAAATTHVWRARWTALSLWSGHTTRVESQVNSSFLSNWPLHTCGEPSEQLFPSEAAARHVCRARWTALSLWSGHTTRVESQVNSSFLSNWPLHTCGEPSEQLFPSEAATRHVCRARWTALS